MVVWSRLCRAAGQKLLQNGAFRASLVNKELARCMSDKRLMLIQPSRFQWHKTKDWFHFYFLLGFIPVISGIFLINVFIGPATLEPIPEGYVPKEWEYHQHPIKRFFQRYLFPSPQQEYEKYLHHIYHESQVRQVRMLEHQIEDAMAQYRDFRGPYFKEYYGSKFLYSYKQKKEEQDSMQ